MRNAFVICLLLLMSSLVAFTEPCPGEFGVSAEWLYMLPSYDQSYFVIDSSTSSEPNGPRIPNDQQWHSGYRVEGIYAFCDRPNNIRVRWTHFPTFSDEESVSGSDLFGTFNHPDIALAAVSGTMSLRDTFDFYFLDLLFNQKLFCCGPFQMDVQGGVQYGSLDLREQMVFNGTGVSRTIKAHSQLWGIGPEIGYEFSYCLMDCLTLTGRGNVTLLISERKSSFQDDGIPVAVNNEEYWMMIPTTDLRFGLSYETPLNLSAIPCFGCFCGCVHLDFEVGYEVITYNKGLNRIFFVDNDNDGSSFDELMDFTLHGPYAHLGFTF